MLIVLSKFKGNALAQSRCSPNPVSELSDKCDTNQRAGCLWVLAYIVCQLRAFKHLVLWPHPLRHLVFIFVNPVNLSLASLQPPWSIHHNHANYLQTLNNSTIWLIRKCIWRNFDPVWTLFLLFYFIPTATTTRPFKYWFWLEPQHFASRMIFWLVLIHLNYVLYLI